MEEHTKTVSVIRNLEEQLLTTEVRRCVKMVSDLLAEEFVEFGSSGCAYNKQQIIESLQNEVPAARTISQFKTMTLAPEVILATYRCTRQETAKQPTYSLRCSVWKRIAGQWKMVFHQGTAVMQKP